MNVKEICGNYLPMQHQHIRFDNCKNIRSVNVLSDDVTVTPSQEVDESAEVQFRKIVEGRWKVTSFPGRMMDVHFRERYLAYTQERCKLKSDTMEQRIVVKQLDSSKSAELRDVTLKGEIQDIEFSRTTRPIFLAFATKDGCVWVYEIAEKEERDERQLVEESGRAFQARKVFSILPYSNIAANRGPYHRVRWCPFVARISDKASFDSENINDLDESRGRIVGVFSGSRIDIYNIDTIVAQYGSFSGSVTPSTIKNGKMTIFLAVAPSPRDTITDVRISPDGTSVAYASSDGFLRVCEIKFKDDTQEEVPYKFVLHRAGSLISLHFLDDNDPYSKASDEWSLAASVAHLDKRNEIKIWRCKGWRCLQTINFLPISVNKSEIFNKFKTYADPSNSYIFLSDADMRMLYILCVEKLKISEKKPSVKFAYVTNISEFSTPFKAINMNIFEVRRKTLAREQSLRENAQFPKDEQISCSLLANAFLMEKNSIGMLKILFDLPKQKILKHDAFNQDSDTRQSSYSSDYWDSLEASSSHARISDLTSSVTKNDSHKLLQPVFHVKENDSYAHNSRLISNYASHTDIPGLISNEMKNNLHGRISGPMSSLRKNDSSVCVSGPICENDCHAPISNIKINDSHPPEKRNLSPIKKELLTLKKVNDKIFSRRHELLRDLGETSKLVNDLKSSCAKFNMEDIITSVLDEMISDEMKKLCSGENKALNDLLDNKMRTLREDRNKPTTSSHTDDRKSGAVKNNAFVNWAEGKMFPLPKRTRKKTNGNSLLESEKNNNLKNEPFSESLRLDKDEERRRNTNASINKNQNIEVQKDSEEFLMKTATFVDSKKEENLLENYYLAGNEPQPEINANTVGKNRNKMLRNLSQKKDDKTSANSCDITVNKRLTQNDDDEKISVDLRDNNSKNHQIQNKAIITDTIRKVLREHSQKEGGKTLVDSSNCADNKHQLQNEANIIEGKSDNTLQKMSQTQDEITFANSHDLTSDECQPSSDANNINAKSDEMLRKNLQDEDEKTLEDMRNLAKGKHQLHNDANNINLKSEETSQKNKLKEDEKTLKDLRNLAKNKRQLQNEPKVIEAESNDSSQEQLQKEDEKTRTDMRDVPSKKGQTQNNFNFVDRKRNDALQNHSQTADEKTLVGSQVVANDEFQLQNEANIINERSDEMLNRSPKIENIRFPRETSAIKDLDTDAKPLVDLKNFINEKCQLENNACITNEKNDKILRKQSQKEDEKKLAGSLDQKEDEKILAGLRANDKFQSQNDVNITDKKSDEEVSLNHSKNIENIRFPRETNAINNLDTGATNLVDSLSSANDKCRSQNDANATREKSDKILRKDLRINENIRLPRERIAINNSKSNDKNNSSIEDNAKKMFLKHFQNNASKELPSKTDVINDWEKTLKSSYDLANIKYERVISSFLEQNLYAEAFDYVLSIKDIDKTEYLCERVTADVMSELINCGILDSEIILHLFRKFSDNVGIYIKTCGKHLEICIEHLKNSSDKEKSIFLQNLLSNTQAVVNSTTERKVKKCGYKLINILSDFLRKENESTTGSVSDDGSS